MSAGKQNDPVITGPTLSAPMLLCLIPRAASGLLIFSRSVLRYRAKMNRISAAGLQARDFHRYTEDALDLCDVLGSYVPGGKVKLDEVSKILGLTGKPDGVDGSPAIAKAMFRTLIESGWSMNCIVVFGA
jgi:hypothetical protein